MTGENSQPAYLDLLRGLLEKTCKRNMRTPKDFDFLTQSIYEHTNQMLNSSTIKRLYGYVGSVKVPRESTLNILCQYVGYSSWQDFTSENDILTQLPPENNKGDEEVSKTGEAMEDFSEDAPEKESGLLKLHRKEFKALAVLFILSLCLGLWCLLPSQHAEEVGFHFSKYYENSGMFYFKVIDQDSAFVAFVAKNDTMDNTYTGDITVPDTVTYNGVTYKVTEIGRKAFFRCHDLVSINLPSTLRSIDERSFQYDDSLAIINIPESVNSIGFKAMANSPWLRNVHLPKQLEKVPEGCFFFDSLLVRIEIPQNVREVGRDAFACCVRLKEVKLPAGLRRIDRGVFWECHGLETLTIPAKVSEFGDFVFWGCDHLKDIYMLNPIPPRITDIFKNFHLNIHVPASSVDAYRQALYWEDQNIVSL